MLVKVKDNPGLVRDLASNAILNVNQEALLAYKRRKNQAGKVDLLEERINMIDKRFSNIEEKLTLILEKIL